MTPAGWPVVDAACMRALDRHTIEALGVPAELLMECAGLAVAAEAERWLAPGGRALVWCGPGNNGGDGYVAARHLHLRGIPVRIDAAGEPGAGPAKENARRAEQVGVPRAAARESAAAGDVVVDALFGTGLTRALGGAAAAAVRRIAVARAAGARVVAVDLPSGLHSDTGAVLGLAVAADVTVTLGLPKLGLVLEPGRSLAGQVRVARIGIADEAPGAHVPAALWTRAAAGARLPARPAHGHKGSFGHLLLVAGSRGKTGAAALAAAGALRSGAGLVTIACPAGSNAVLEEKCTEAMTAPLAETADGALALAAQPALRELAAARDVVVAGPGLGRHAELAALLHDWLPRLAVPLVLDADALYALREEPGVLKRRRAPTLLTPHPGEAGTLIGASAAEVNADRPGAARALADATGAVVLLKGAASLAVGPDRAQPFLVNPTGGPWLASGGTGDVLAGIAGALLAQGLPALAAAGLAAYVHGAAADALAARRGRSGLLASEVADALPETFEALRAAASSGGLPGGGDRLDFPEPR